tara:strand:- start:12 stop:542 length:531 start_codon:yes stop_codon:yes gene_type:complete
MKGFIYKLYCDNNDLVYYGSTIQKLSCRIAGHRRDWKNKAGTKSHLLFDTGEKVKITLVEIVEYEDKLELNQRENHYIKNFPCVNKQLPQLFNYTSKADYFKQYKKINKSRIDLYREKNKDKIAETKKKYREKNKDKIAERAGIHNDCECGGRYTNINKSTHFKTKKHTKYIKKIE